ncbi:MAG: type II toxin-antitoxin system RelE/ParE family toxin [Clostridiales bacterium]|nr:type II toxin-antitoxin system RelE/ParE family toxin [Clostridiales bacterium]
MDPFDRKIIISWLGKNLQGCVDPRRHGKSLIGERAEQWRYRVGDYRVIAEIQDEKVLILVLAIGHRRAVYERR